MDGISIEAATLKASAYCSSAERCRHDVLRRLSAWGLGADDADVVIAYLLKEGFVNEERYALAFASDKLRFSAWGRIKTELALKRKSIPVAFIQSALSKVYGSCSSGASSASSSAIDDDGEESCSAASSREYDDVVFRALSAKFKSLRFKDSYDARAKLFRFGAARGYEVQRLKSAIDRITKNIPSDSDGQFFPDV